MLSVWARAGMASMSSCLAGPAGADVPVLGAFPALDLGVLERLPICTALREAGNVFVNYLFFRTPSSSGGRGFWQRSYLFLPLCFSRITPRSALQPPI